MSATTLRFSLAVEHVPDGLLHMRVVLGPL
jgi:hypothetical protein